MTRKKRFFVVADGFGDYNTYLLFRSRCELAISEVNTIIYEVRRAEQKNRPDLIRLSRQALSGLEWAIMNYVCILVIPTRD